MTSTVPAPGTRTAEGSALQAVLLDMDGTLVDTEGFWWDVEVEIFAAPRPHPRRLLAPCRGRRPHDPQRGLPDRGHRRRHHPRRAHRPAQRGLRGPDRPRPAADAGRRPAAGRTGRARDPDGPGLRLAPAHHRPRPGLARPPALRPDGRRRRGARAPSRTPTRTCSPPPDSARTRPDARSSRTPRPVSPRRRPRAARWWPCPPWRPSPRPPGAPSCAPWKRSTWHFCADS